MASPVRVAMSSAAEITSTSLAFSFLFLILRFPNQVLNDRALYCCSFLA